MGRLGDAGVAFPGLKLVLGQGFLRWYAMTRRRGLRGWSFGDADGPWQIVGRSAVLIGGIARRAGRASRLSWFRTIHPGPPAGMPLQDEG
jgi:hypothetical protein